MLAEMGLSVWWPMPEALALPDPPPSVRAEPQNASESIAARADQEGARAQNDAKALRAHPAPPIRPDAGLQPLPEGIANMGWAALTQAVATCQACAMCLGRQTPVWTAPPDGLRADWLFVGDPPDEAQERAARPFVQEPGQLLDNMLRALSLQRWSAELGADTDAAHTAYLSLVLKCRPARPTATDANALATCSHYLRREIALLQPKVIVTMGRHAMQVLLGQAQPDALRLPLGKLRNTVWYDRGVPVVVTYPPVYLLRNGQDKAAAWHDLCLAAEVAAGCYLPSGAAPAGEGVTA